MRADSGLRILSGADGAVYRGEDLGEEGGAGVASAKYWKLSKSKKLLSWCELQNMFERYVVVILSSKAYDWPIVVRCKIG